MCTSQVNLFDHVEEKVDEFVDAGRTFTAADVSNALKQDGIACQHSQVAPLVRQVMNDVLSDPDNEYLRHVEWNTPFRHDGNGVFVYYHEDSDPTNYTFPKLLSVAKTVTTHVVNTTVITPVGASQTLVKFYSGRAFSALDIADAIRTATGTSPDLAQLEQDVRAIVLPLIASDQNFWKMSAEEVPYGVKRIGINIYVPTLNGYEASVKDYIASTSKTRREEFELAKVARTTISTGPSGQPTDNTGNVWQKPMTNDELFAAVRKMGSVAKTLQPDGDGRIRVPGKVAGNKRYEAIKLTNGDIYLRRA